MSTNCRSSFTAYLRQRKLEYSTTPNYVTIGLFHFYFDDSMEYVTLRYTPHATFVFSIPYCSPQTIVDKWQSFRNMLVKVFKSPIPHFLDKNPFINYPGLKRKYKKRTPSVNA